MSRCPDASCGSPGAFLLLHASHNHLVVLRTRRLVKLKVLGVGGESTSEAAEEKEGAIIP